MFTMPSTPEIVGFDTLREKFGPWPAFHDAEILRIILDRSGPSATFELLVPVKGEPKSAHYEVHILFMDIDVLHLTNFNYQNVIFSMTIDPITEERFATGKAEDRIKIGIHSSFGAECSFTCAHGRVLRIEKTNTRTGNSHQDPAG